MCSFLRSCFWPAWSRPPVTLTLPSQMFEELFLACLASLGMTAFVFYGIHLQGQWVCFWLVSGGEQKQGEGG